MLHALVHQLKHCMTAYAIVAPKTLTVKQAMRIAGVEIEDEDKEWVELTEAGPILNGFKSKVPQENKNWDPMRRAVEGGETSENDTITPTLGACANAAEIALRLFTDAETEKKVEDYHASDLISNILHLADKAGWDIDLILSRAEDNFRAERKPDQFE